MLGVQCWLWNHLDLEVIYMNIDGSSEPSVVWISGGVRCRWKFRTQCSLDSRWGYVSHEFTH